MRMVFQHDKTRKRRILYTRETIATNIYIYVMVRCGVVWCAVLHIHILQWSSTDIFINWIHLQIKNRFDRDHYCYCVVCAYECDKFVLLFLHKEIWERLYDRKEEEEKKKDKERDKKSSSQEQISSYAWMFSEAIRNELKHNKAKWINLMDLNLFEIEKMCL